MRSVWNSPWTLPLRLVAFLGWFIGQFVVTSLQVVTLIMTPGRQPQPGIVKMSIDGLSDSEVTVLLALITITPDTLVIALDREKGEMFVHGMFVAGDAEAFRSALNSTRGRLLRGIRLRPATELTEGVGV